MNLLSRSYTVLLITKPVSLFHADKQQQVCSTAHRYVAVSNRVKVCVRSDVSSDLFPCCSVSSSRILDSDPGACFIKCHVSAFVFCLSNFSLCSGTPLFSGCSCSAAFSEASLDRNIIWGAHQERPLPTVYNLFSSCKPNVLMFLLNYIREDQLGFRHQKSRVC